MTAALFYTTFIAAFIASLGGIPAAFTLYWRLPPQHQSSARVLALALLLIAVGTITCMEVTLRHLANVANEPIHGLIGEPIANTGGDHQYTPHGKEYERKAFVAPFVIGAVTLFAAAGLALRRKPRSSKLLAFQGWAFAGSLGSMYLFWIIREVSAWDIFI